MSLLPGIIRRCRTLAWRAGLASDGSARAAAKVQRVLDTHGRELFQRSGVPGLSAFVQFAAGPSAQLHLGLADPAANLPVTQQTCFQVLSMSKPLTAMCVLHLARAGTLDLDQPINRVLSSWALTSADPANPALDPARVTVRSILCHAAGLNVPRHPWTDARDLRRGLDTLNHPDPSFLIQVARPPGHELCYSGGGYVILQALIEEITGEHFASVALRTVIEPLGMSGEIDLSPRVLPRLAARHDHHNQPLPTARTIAPGSSGLTCTARDLAILWSAVLPGPRGEPPGRGIISPEQARQMTLPQITAPDGKMCGLAFFLGRKRTDTEFFHSGYSYGWWGHAEGQLRRRVVFTILTNGDRGRDCVRPLSMLVRQCLLDHAL